MKLIEDALNALSRGKPLTPIMIDELKKMFGDTVFNDVGKPSIEPTTLTTEEENNPWDPAPKDDSIVMFTEFPSEAKPEYPWNYVTVTPAGHQIELDNTPSHERIRIQHAEGSYFEMMPSGRETKKTSGLYQQFVGEDKELLVQANEKTQIGGNRTRLISGNDSDTIAGDRSTKIDGSQSEIIGMHREVSILGNDTLTVDGDGTIIVKGNVKIIVQGDADLTVEGNVDAKVNGNMSQAVQGNLDIKAQNISMVANDKVFVDGSRIDLGS